MTPEELLRQTKAVAREATEARDRLTAQAITLEFKTGSRKRADAGKKSIEDSPLFGGERQGEMF